MEKMVQDFSQEIHIEKKKGNGHDLQRRQFLLNMGIFSQ